MSARDDYSTGAPCWVDTVQPDLEVAARFSGPLFGWDFDEPVTMSGGAGVYRSARVRGRLVAGIAEGPAAVWITYVRVRDIDTAVAAAQCAGGSQVHGPVDVGTDGRLSVLADPSGVAFAVWQANRRMGAQRVNEPGAWAMSALHTCDPERARASYGELFGWQLDTFPELPVAFWRLPGYEGGEPGQPFPRDVVAVMAPVDDAVPPHWAVNVRVEDCDQTTAQAAALGGTVLMPPTDAAGVRSALLADPQGGVVAISGPSAGFAP